MGAQAAGDPLTAMKRGMRISRAVITPLLLAPLPAATQMAAAFWRGAQEDA